MTLHPLVRQITGAVIGASVAAGIYGAYTGASGLLGADLTQTIADNVVALSGTGSNIADGRELARVFPPQTEPVPLPEIGAPLRVRAVPEVPPPTPPKPVFEPVANPIPETQKEPIGKPAPLPPEPKPIAAQITTTSKAEKLPSSGPTEWLLAMSAVGAAAGWHRRRLSALLTPARQPL